MNKELIKESISQFEVAIDNLKQSLLEEDKPKVGDVVSVVLSGEEYSFITKVSTIEFNNGVVDTINGWHVDYCNKLTQQEAINLLFTVKQ